MSTGSYVGSRLAFILATIVFAAAACSSSAHSASSSTTARPIATTTTAPPTTTTAAPTTTTTTPHVGKGLIDPTTHVAVEVYATEIPTARAPRFSVDSAGTEWSLVQAGFCANNGPVLVNPIDFVLVDTAAQQWHAYDSSLAPFEPEFPLTTVAANQCVSGLIAYEIPKGTTITKVIWSDPLEGGPLTWKT